MSEITKLFEDHVKNLIAVGSNGQQKGLCPFHDNTHPSFSVNLNQLSTEYGLWKCFAGCGAGTAADFAERLGLDPGPYRRGNGDPLHNPRNRSTDVTRSQQINADLELSIEDKKRAMECHQHLLDNFDALKEEGRIPSCWTRQAVKQTFTGYDSSAGAITFVHTNEKGKAVNLKWHKSEDGERPKSIKGHGSNRLYPRHLIEESNPEFIIWAEGELDVITCLSYGLLAVTGTCGTKSIPDDLTPLCKFGSIVVIQDNDKSGEQGAQLFAKQCQQDCPRTEIFIHHWSSDLPVGFDITNYFENDGTEDSFDVDVLEKAELYEEPERHTAEHAHTKDLSPPTPRLDQTLLTPSLSNFLAHTSRTTDCPDEFLVAAYLTTFAGAIGNKLRGPLDLRPNIWIAVFAPSGIIRKSTALKIAKLPSKQIQKDFDQAYQRDLAQYDQDMKKWEADQAAGKNSGPPPTKPKPTFLLVPLDFSDAGFYMALKENSAAGVIVASEFSDFHRKLHRDYTALVDAFLTAYDNEEMVRITRRYGREAIEEPTFSLLGATTFVSFRSVFKSSEMENGFLQRVFPIVLSEPTKSRLLFLDRTETDPKFIKTTSDKIRRWLERTDTIDVTIPEDIKAAFSTWESDFVARTNSLGIGWIEPHVERFVPGCLKLAMIIESMEVSDPLTNTNLAISMDSLRCSQMLIEHLFVPSLVTLREEVLVFGKERQNEKLIEQKLKEAGGQATRTVLARRTRLSKREMDEALASLVDKGLITIHEEQITREQGGGSQPQVIVWIGN